jgi:hypothetical protein
VPCSRIGVEDVRWCFAGARVWLDVVKASEDLDCWVSLNAIVFTKFCLFCAVDLYKRNVLLFQSCSGFLIFGRESLAVAAPWRKEFRKDQVMVLDKVFECVLSSGQAMILESEKARTVFRS